MSDEELRLLKRQVTRDALAQGKTPAARWLAIQKEVELSRNLRAFAEAGVAVTQISATLRETNRDEVLKALEPLLGGQTDPAVAAYKKTLLEAEKAVRREPSAQAFTLKGMAEANLARWKDAEKSFRHAFSLGFEDGETWAGDVALLGLATGLVGSATGTAFSLVLARLIFQSAWHPSYLIPAVGTAAMVAICIGTGRLATASSLRASSPCAPAGGRRAG